ncbi:hypothetical protein BDP27DRAFT_115970 [Rhodocollybia butyracea]|uniref:Uncharacterized protein n=1 Tax=Rhodocollybia butyracea TaxID=206335 RepID=A0A9P5U3S1_9AGAR|nr:hypothetical protein BDP27DRAFT_115970 [Rhodocollybia butyracea]
METVSGQRRFPDWEKEGDLEPKNAIVSSNLSSRLVVTVTIARHRPQGSELPAQSCSSHHVASRRTTSLTLNKVKKHDHAVLYTSGNIASSSQRSRVSIGSTLEQCTLTNLPYPPGPACSIFPIMPITLNPCKFSVWYHYAGTWSERDACRDFGMSTRRMLGGNNGEQRRGILEENEGKTREKRPLSTALGAAVDCLGA